MTETAVKKSSASTVVVACKHPPGILMRVFKSEEYDVPVLGGGTRKEFRSVAIGEPVKINGPAVPFGRAPSYPIIGGYALTMNVPADVAKAWFEQNKDSALVKNDVIHMNETMEFAEGQSNEQEEVKSGLERLDVRSVQKNGHNVPRDPRWPAKLNPNLSGVETDTRDAA
ncbi:MAG TPA: hypothetical protein VGC14_02595 [Rhizobium sp.]